MTREFVPYQEALALKELSFNEKCLAYWFNETPLNPEGQCLVYYRKPYDNVGITNGIIREYSWAPIYQQAFRWFREKYGLDSAVLENRYVIETKEDLPNWYYGFKTYEESELACLKKLIEIVKTKQL